MLKYFKLKTQCASSSDIKTNGKFKKNCIRSYQQRIERAYTAPQMLKFRRLTHLNTVSRLENSHKGTLVGKTDPVKVFVHYRPHSFSFSCTYHDKYY